MNLPLDPGLYHHANIVATDEDLFRNYRFGQCQRCFTGANTFFLDDFP